MFSVRKIAARQLLNKNTYSLGFGKKRKATPNDLEKYDVVVVGAGLGSVLATHLDAVVGEKYKIFVAYDNPVTSYAPERNLYEQGWYLPHHIVLPSLTSGPQLVKSSARTSLSLTIWVSIRSTLVLARSPFAMDVSSSTRIWWLPWVRRTTTSRLKVLKMLGLTLFTLSTQIRTIFRGNLQ